MPWLQLELESTPHCAEQLSDLLHQAGAGAVSLQDAADQPLFEPALGTTPLWQATRVIGLFESDTDINAVLAQLQTGLGQTALPDWHLNPLEDRDWVRAWLDDFQPMSFGHDLWICPTNFNPPEPDAINLILDPGLAFGTGTHPTTAMCLRWLAANPPRELPVIDYGCGSGVLAIAACLLGASRADAIDTDPQALLATQDNAVKNHIAAQIETFLPGDFRPHAAPLLLANILAGPLCELAPQFSQRVTTGGQLLLSGILHHQAEAVMHAYETDFEMTLSAQQAEWVCLSGRRRG